MSLGHTAPSDDAARLPLVLTQLNMSGTFEQQMLDGMLGKESDTTPTRQTVLVRLDTSIELWAIRQHMARCRHTVQLVSPKLAALTLYGLDAITGVCDHRASHRGRHMSPAAFIDLDGATQWALAPRLIPISVMRPRCTPSMCLENTSIVTQFERRADETILPHWVQLASSGARGVNADWGGLSAREFFYTVVFGTTPIMEQRINDWEQNGGIVHASYPHSFLSRFSNLRVAKALRRHDTAHPLSNVVVDVRGPSVDQASGPVGPTPNVPPSTTPSNDVTEPGIRRERLLLLDVVKRHIAERETLAHDHERDEGNDMSVVEPDSESTMACDVEQPESTIGSMSPLPPPPSSPSPSSSTCTIAHNDCDSIKEEPLVDIKGEGDLEAFGKNVQIKAPLSFVERSTTQMTNAMYWLSSQHW